MQQSLTNLIRLSKFRLDEKKAKLAQLRENADTIKRNIDKINEEIASEGKGVGNDFLKASSYSNWREAAKAREANLQQSLNDIEQAIQAVNDEILELFNELKRYEITKDDLDLQTQRKQNRRMGQQMDEMGLRRFRKGQGA
jgi:flagellar protein FliJ